MKKKRSTKSEAGTRPKILVILGPTATGKSNLAIKLAKKFNGEVVSADSRQVYTGLDIGTGKITPAEMQGVKHHLLDVSSPKKVFTVSDFQKQANQKIKAIIDQSKLPIICGGTGFYLDAITEGLIIPEVPPNQKLRAKLEQKSTSELFVILKKLDQRRARTIDKNNPRRLIRAIEIVTLLGFVPHLEASPPSQYKVLKIGLTLPPEELKKKITIRLFARIKEGMIEEAKRLHRHGLSWQRMEALGLEYRYLAKYLRKFPGLSASDPRCSAMATELRTAIWHYAKRQMTWFKRDKNIKWFAPKNQNIEKFVRAFLKP